MRENPKKISGVKLAKDWISNVLIQLIIRSLLWLPIDLRRRLAGAVMANFLAPLAGYRRRIRANLALVMPDMPKDEIERIVRQVPRNMGYTLIEMFSAKDFSTGLSYDDVQGPGVEALEKARKDKRPVMLVTGHIGNFEAARGTLMAAGYPIGGLYKPMKNRFFNRYYVKAISALGTPIFPRSRRGLADMVRFMRSGGMVGIVLDQYVRTGELMDFLGVPARTSLSAAEMALRYEAMVIPCYGLRRPDGGFDIVVEEPIPPDTPLNMTKALNRSLEARVRAHMDQWMWTHQRWKSGKPITGA